MTIVKEPNDRKHSLRFNPEMYILKLYDWA